MHISLHLIDFMKFIQNMQKGNLHELLLEIMNSKENQVFNLLLTEYIFSKKTTKQKAKGKKVRMG